MLDLETGELVERRLDHESGEAKRFYEGLKEAALVGIESTGYTRWFAEMLAELGRELVVGGGGKIRAKETRKQKHDRRDAALILELLGKGDFPKIWLPLREGLGRRREDLVQLVRQLSTWIKELDHRIAQEVAHREEAQRLMTHPGVGAQTARAPVLVYGPVERFPDDRHLTSYLGLIPQEASSAGGQRFGHLPKQGNRLMRFLLVAAAGIASRYDPRLQRAYRRLAFRKGAAVAKAAVARKLAIRLYIMLRDRIDYAGLVGGVRMPGCS
jgi:transposase